MLEGIEVREVSESTRMMKDFIMLPWSAGLYDNDPAWIPPLIGEQKKFFSSKHGYFFEIGECAFFVAYRDGKPVGRITAHISHAYEGRHDKETGFFGFFESLNNQEIANTLFDAAASWLRGRGKTSILGPQSFGIYDDIGFEVKGTEIRPVIGLNHLAPYYKDLAEAHGFTKSIDWYGYMVKPDRADVPKLEQTRERLLARMDVEIVTMDLENFEKWDSDIFKVFNKAWVDNWGHVPLTEKQWFPHSSDRKRVGVPPLLIAAVKNGEMVGFMVTIPDINPALQVLNGRMYPWRLPKFFAEMKKTKGLRTIVMGILPEYRRKRIGIVMYLTTVINGFALNYEWCDCSLVVETNTTLINTLRKFNADQYKTYRIYQKQI